MNKPTRISNKEKAVYTRLFKDGYYFKPCVYDNVTIYELTKDVNPSGNPKPISSRRTFAEYNKTTSLFIANMFGFKFKGSAKYFGKAEPIGNYMKRWTVFEPEVARLL